MVNKNTKIFSTVSLLFDLSGGIVVTILPLYLISIGLSPSQIGMIEGIGLLSLEGLRLISAYVAELSGKRKIFVKIGYTLSALAKPLFAITTNFYSALIVRALDRGGKGIRDSARDAMIAYSEKNTGVAFGILKMFDNIGALLGPLVAYYLINIGISFKEIFLIAFVPAIIGAMLVSFTKEITKKKQRIEKGFIEEDMKKYILFIFIYSLALFSDSFLLIYGLGLGENGAIILYTMFNLFYIVDSYLIGNIYELIKEKSIYIGLISILLTGLFAIGNIASLVIFFYAIAKTVMIIIPKAQIKNITKHYLAGDALVFTAIGVGMAISNIIIGNLWEIEIGNIKASYLYLIIISFIATIYLLYLKKTKIFKSKKQ